MLPSALEEGANNGAVGAKLDANFVHHPTAVLSLSSLPSTLAKALAPFDENQTGTLTSREIEQASEVLGMSCQGDLPAEGGYGGIKVSSMPKGFRGTFLRKHTNINKSSSDVLTNEDVVNSFQTLAKEKKSKTLFRNMLFGGCLFSALLVAILAVTMAVIVEKSKDTTVDKRGDLLVKGSSDVVRVASSDFELVNGVLKSRGASSTNENAVQVSQKTHMAKLSSLLPDQDLLELKSLKITQGEIAWIHFQVLATARYPDNLSRHGSVVVIYTHVGELTLDGYHMTFHEAMEGAFTRAGFTVHGGRRLLGAVEMLGLFNMLSAAFSNYDDLDDTARSYVEKLRFPAFYFANVTIIEFCDYDDGECFTGGNMSHLESLDTALEAGVYECSDNKKCDRKEAIVKREVHHVGTLADSKVPVSRTQQAQRQYPSQVYTVLHNMTHSLSFQTYRNVNYHCSLEATDELAIAVNATEPTHDNSQEPTGGAPEMPDDMNDEGVMVTFEGTKEVNYVMCNHYIIRKQGITNRIHYFEHADERRLYQITMGSTVRRFDTVVFGEDVVLPPTESFNIQPILDACDPDRIIQPVRYDDGLVDAPAYPEKDWGTELVENWNNFTNYTNATVDMNYLSRRMGGPWPEPGELPDDEFASLKARLTLVEEEEIDVPDADTSFAGEIEEFFADRRAGLGKTEGYLTSVGTGFDTGNQNYFSTSHTALDGERIFSRIKVVRKRYVLMNSWGGESYFSGIEISSRDTRYHGDCGQMTGSREVVTGAGGGGPWEGGGNGITITRFNPVSCYWDMLSRSVRKKCDMVDCKDHGELRDLTLTFKTSKWGGAQTHSCSGGTGKLPAKSFVQMTSSKTVEWNKRFYRLKCGWSGCDWSRKGSIEDRVKLYMQAAMIFTTKCGERQGPMKVGFTTYFRAYDMVWNGFNAGSYSKYLFPDGDNCASRDGFYNQYFSGGVGKAGLKDVPGSSCPGPAASAETLAQLG